MVQRESMEIRIHSPKPDTTDGLPTEDVSVSHLPETAEDAADWIATLKRLITLARRLNPDGSLKDDPDGS